MLHIQTRRKPFYDQVPTKSKTVFRPWSQNVFSTIVLKPVFGPKSDQNANVGTTAPRKTPRRKKRGLFTPLVAHGRVRPPRCYSTDGLWRPPSKGPVTLAEARDEAVAAANPACVDADVDVPRASKGLPGAVEILQDLLLHAVLKHAPNRTGRLVEPFLMLFASALLAHRATHHWIFAVVGGKIWVRLGCQLMLQAAGNGRDQVQTPRCNFRAAMHHVQQASHAAWGGFGCVHELKGCAGADVAPGGNTQKVCRSIAALFWKTWRTVAKTRVKVSV